MKFVKKALTWLLIIVLALSLFFGVIYAIGMLTLIREDGWEYHVATGGWVLLSGYTVDGTETVEVPAYLRDHPVTTINSFTFESETLREITLPITVEFFSTFSARHCPNLMAINVAEGSVFLKSVGGALLNADGSQLICIPRGLTSYDVPQGVEVVGQAAAFASAKLQRVTLPEGVTTLEDDAFSYCSALTEVTLPASVVNFGKSGVFDECPLLTLVVVPGSAGEAYAIGQGIPFRYAE